jgi:MoxR-like ATPase
MQMTGAERPRAIRRVLGAGEILGLQETVRRVPIADYVVHYAMRLSRRTRVGESQDVPPFIREWVRWGVGPRACQHLILAARARALLHGRHYVAVEDVNALAAPVMRHRLVPTFTASSEGVGPDRIVAELIRNTPARESPLSGDETIQQVLGPRDAR